MATGILSGLAVAGGLALGLFLTKRKNDSKKENDKQYRNEL